jgi:lysophospholipase L1-like esterase
MQTMIELKPNDTIVFIGDSITDADRLERAYKPFGNGYVHFAANHLLAKYPEYNLRIINTGISGNTVRDLNKRWQKDCLNHKPDVLSILIGINDLCRQYENRMNEAVFIKEYELTYERLLSMVKEKYNCQLVLMEPFLFCEDKTNPVYETLQEYIHAVHTLAEKFSAVLVRLKDSIDKKIKTVPQERWSDDMIHPYQWAHFWIAQRWLDTTKL